MGRIYFFLKPVGHLGLTAVTFLVSLPFAQMIVDFLEVGVFFVVSLSLVSGFVMATAEIESMTDVLCCIFALIVGLEKVKFVA